MGTTEDAKAKPGTAAEGMGVAKGGWFTELSTLWPGQGLSLKVDEVLFQDRSKFQVCQRSLELARVCLPGAFQVISHSGIKHANHYCRHLRSSAPAWQAATYKYGIFSTDQLPSVSAGCVCGEVWRVRHSPSLGWCEHLLACASMLKGATKPSCSVESLLQHCCLLCCKCEGVTRAVSGSCCSTGVIQCTERDEFSYQEMITHLPLCALKVHTGLQRLRS